MFNFRMQTVLDVRKTIEDKIITEFSQQQRELNQEMEVLQGIQLKKADMIDALRQIENQKVSVLDIAMQTAGIKRCQQQEDLQRETIQICSAKIDKKRDELFEATKKKKAMEICRTKHLEKYRAEERLLERAMIDELVIVGYNRRKER